MDKGQCVRFQGNGLWTWPCWMRSKSYVKHYVSIVKIEKHIIVRVRGYSQFIATNRKITSLSCNKLSFSLQMFAINEKKSIPNVLDRHLWNTISTISEHYNNWFKNVVNIVDFFYLIVIKNYSQYAFKIQVKIVRYMN